MPRNAKNLNDLSASWQINAHQRPPKLTLKQMAYRSLDPDQIRNPFQTALDPDTEYETIQFADPEKLLDGVEQSKIQFALRLREGLLRFSMGVHKIRRRYLFATVKLALLYKKDRDKIKEMHNFMDWKTSLKLPKLEKFEEDFLGWMIKFVFLTTDFATSNTCSRYKNALQYYYDTDVDLNRTKYLLEHYGPEKLYRHSVKRRKFLDAQVLVVESAASPFREIDEVDDAPAPECGEEDSQLGAESERLKQKLASQTTEEEFDLPPADLDDDIPSDAGGELESDQEFFDVDEVFDLVQESLACSLQVSADLAKHGKAIAPDLMTNALQLSIRLTKIGLLMKA